MITTRPHSRIQPLFHPAEICVISGAVESQRADLRAYLTERLTDPALMTVIAGSRVEQTIAIIESRASGNFQYARSVLEALGAADLDPDQLDELPDALESFYYRRATRRFPHSADYRLARVVLEILMVAREPLTPRQLATMTGLEPDAELRPALDSLSCFVGLDIGVDGGEVYRIAHKSISDWLLSTDARAFRIDAVAGRSKIVNHCMHWQKNRDPYALRHLIAHLLEESSTDEALDAVHQGLFEQRRLLIDGTRLDVEDSRNLTLALIARRDKNAVLGLARTVRIGQRDGVAAGLQASRPEDLSFVDGVVRALLALKS